MMSDRDSRWIANAKLIALTLFLMPVVACSKDRMCEPISTRCPVIVDINPYWDAPPDEVAADEAVVEVSPAGGMAVVMAAPDRDFFVAGTLEIERACQSVQPVILRKFEVRSVVQGNFRAKAFYVADWPPGCGTDYEVPLDDSWLRTRGHVEEGESAFLVIRPASLSEAGLTIHGWDQWRRDRFKIEPLMTIRPGGAPIPPTDADSPGPAER